MRLTTHIILLSALMLAGCLTQQQLIARRISEKQCFFDALPPEGQERLRQGKVAAGDSVEAAWIVYGEPDRKFIKVTGTATNEIWSYSSYDFDRFDRPRPIYHPVMSSSGRTIWQADYIWTPETQYQAYEYLRIEFEDKRIKGYEAEQR